MLVSREPHLHRTVAFFDAQNVFHAARRAFGVRWPDFDPMALAEAVCRSRGWQLNQVRFYTGTPSEQANPFWFHFWEHRLAALGRQGVQVINRPIRYRTRAITLPGGTTYRWQIAEEKGIDVRIAVDLIGMAYREQFDVALIFSQDQDLAEVGDEVRRIARSQARWIKLACAFPVSPTTKNRRGIANSDWIPINATMYEKCTDPRDYRPKPDSP